MPTKNYGIPYIDEEEQRINLVKETSDAFDKIDEVIADAIEEVTVAIEDIASVMMVGQDTETQAFNITFFGSKGEIALAIPKTATDGADITISYAAYPNN